MSRKVLIIGLDGATFRLIKPLVEAGKLPTLQRLLQEGTSGVHHSTYETNSPNAWSTFITGKNAGKHGIFGFFETTPQSYELRFVNGSFRHGKSLWRIVSDHDYRVGVVNVPMTYPAEAVNGFLIAGPDAPKKEAPGFTFPPRMLQAVEAEVGSYTIEAGASALVRQGRPDKALLALHESIRKKTAVAKCLLTRHECDLFMITFTEADRVQHHFWKYINPLHPAYASMERDEFGNAIYDVYAKLDAAIDELIDTAGRDYTIIILSDHGAGPSSNRTFFINRWLASLGHLKYKSDSSLSGFTRIPRDLILKTIYLYARRSLTRTWKRRLRNAMPSLKDKVHTTLLSGSRIDWQNTLAFSRENAPTIYINLKSQFPAGRVEPGKEYEALRDDLIAELLNLSCPVTGQPIVENVLKKEEMYWGPYTDKAPDLLIEWKNDAYTERPEYVCRGDAYTAILEGEELARAEIISRPSGIHHRDGMFLAVGSGIGRAREIAPLELYDVTATVLYLLDIPVPSDYDGKVLTEIFDQGYSENYPVRYSELDSEDRPTCQSLFSPEESEIIERRLRGLGYIE